MLRNYHNTCKTKDEHNANRYTTGENMKTPLTILGILGILLCLSACSICYPTSYRAFIPKSLDSEYKEFERLCKEEIGKVVYARPVPKGTKLEDMLRLEIETKIGDSIAVIIGEVKIKHKEYYYFYVAGFKYYTNWTKKFFYAR